MIYMHISDMIIDFKYSYFFRHIMFFLSFFHFLIIFNIPGASVSLEKSQWSSAVEGPL